MIVLLIFLAGFIWITRDIIRVPETMNDSWFKKYIGNKWVDPQVSWVNKGNYHMILYPILSMFGDLFHTLGTIILLLWILTIQYYYLDYSIIFVILLFLLLHGSGVWLGYNLWRKILN